MSKKDGIVIKKKSKNREKKTKNHDLILMKQKS